MDGALFEWDDGKNKANIVKHKISFFEAQHAFLDPKRIIAEDVEHSRAEKRYYCFGQVDGAVITVRFIPNVVQESASGCVKAPAAPFPQVGPYLKHKTHLRESQPRGFDAARGQFLNHVRYTYRDQKIRIFGARLWRKGRKIYEEAQN